MVPLTSITAFYCVDSEWRIFFVSREDTQHSTNIKERPSMAVAIFQSDQTWDDWKVGLQLFGTCAVTGRRDGGLGATLYKKRFPAYAKWLHALGRGIGYSGAPPFFMFSPESIKLLHEEVLGRGEFCKYQFITHMKRVIEGEREKASSWFFSIESSTATEVSCGGDVILAPLLKAV